MATVYWMPGPVRLHANKAGQLVPVAMVSTTDPTVATTGVSSPTLTLSKTGGTFASLSDGTWAEVAGGLYTIRINETDSNTPGWGVIRAVKAGSAESFVYVTVGIDPEEDIGMATRVRRIFHEGA
jgi:hypothetical protein